MIDRGLSVAEVDGLLEVAGACVDIVKLGWGTALVSANLQPKLERYAAHGIPVVLGGTLTELAIRQGRVEGLIAWLRELGLRHVEISDGTIALEPEVKRELIERLSRRVHRARRRSAARTRDFIMAPYVWVEQIERDLRGGRVEGDRRGARVGHRRHLPRRRRGAHGADRRDRARDRPRAADLRGAAARAAGVAAASASAPSATSATSRPTTCSRWRRCAWACARTRSSASRSAMTDRPGAIDQRATRAVTTVAPAPRVVFALLVLACFAAFFLTQRLKHTPTAVQRFKLTPRFSPTPAGHIKQERISFKLAHADEVTVTIIDSDGRRRGDARARPPGGALQTVLAALERAPRHARTATRSSTAPTGARSLVPRNTAGSRRPANTACA